jgi:hypothetical protein
MPSKLNVLIACAVLPTNPKSSRESLYPSRLRADSAAAAAMECTSASLS